MNRFCDAFKCGATVQSGRFLCPNHWRMVPVATQQTINARYRAGRANFGFLSDLVYLQACVDAIDGIARSEFGAGHQAGPGSYHRLLRVAQRKATT
ncbi:MULTISPECIES: hypothetical protein [unclassified Variovorax]|jgi:hypothetical protein|uniref:hypothetical protein n=1 Tax=unclassified Variovorax TaxID=663243 RepID=UPI000F7F9818|nr:MULTISPECIES: hypothetical protein [unclassified Variovorax]RSZ35112.1 hypothetical protein EJO70_24895 [Variovorax sp. 553]RSZ35870.1 hypothetical protein EJO71_25595 [Variovorax sp. 679]